MPGEKFFIAATGPRGVVPASMAVYFTLKLNDSGFISESISLLGLMFMTIVITVLTTGLSARFIANKTGVVKGDAQDVAVLKKAGIERSKYLVATTDQDNANMLVCQIAKTNFGFTEEKLVARVNKPENLQAFRDLGIRSISPTIATAVMLDGMVGHPVMFSMCEVSGEGDIIEVRVNNKRIFNKAIKEIHLPEDSLIVMVRRKNDSIIAHEQTTLHDGIM